MAVYELEAASEAFDDGEVEISLSDIEADWSMPGLDLPSMTAGVFDSAGTLVAYAQVFKGRAEAVVHPTHRGRGIGHCLLHWTWDTAGTDGRERVGQTVSDHEVEAEALLVSHGYTSTHTSWILRLDLDDVPTEPALPPGYTFRAYRPGLDDLEVFEVIDQAFEEWRGAGSESMGFENWAASVLGQADPGLVVLVLSGEEIVGAALGIDYGPECEGWIQQVAVKRAHRRLGLGGALLQESFRRFWWSGRRQCGVSTDSRTGALGLYLHAGMSVRRTYTHWTKELGRD